MVAELRAGRSHLKAEVNVLGYQQKLRLSCTCGALRPWPDVSEQYEKFNRTELDDSALQLEEPIRGDDIELVKR